jgi:hypothetical protein
MADMHAVKNADRQQQIGVCRVSVEFTDDVHRVADVRAGCPSALSENSGGGLGGQRGESTRP